MQIPVLVAIMEYGFLLTIKKYYSKKCSDINMKYVDEFWPLEHAIENNSLKMVQILLDNGAETDKIVQPYNLTYLHTVTSVGDMCKQLNDRIPWSELQCPNDSH